MIDVSVGTAVGVFLFASGGTLLVVFLRMIFREDVDTDDDDAP